ncbi:putative superfamily III holin-X [Brevibacterium sanguinis]|uniref:Superfamily III holin-X n=2 Tax=Brevibacterium TaxID=1696 RepID=A0ABX9GPC4_9MICO|nr:putative superfamily III holin-X [Brevibacterium sanguinis]RBP69539.1 putative superfamily III holin-X [Brevibacterium celere]
MTEPRNHMPGHPDAGAWPADAPAPGHDPSHAQDPEERARNESLGDMLKEVSQDLSTLIRQEIELAKAEMRESATKAGKGAGMFTGAALSGYMVLLFLSLALWAGISNLTGRVWAAIIVAVIWAIVAGVLAMVGKKELKDVDGVPQTTETVKEIPEAFK